MLTRLPGRYHEVYTAVALWLPSAYAPMGPVSSLSGPSRSPNNPPTSRAASPTARHPGTRRRVHRALGGSYSGIIGLPLCETATLLNRLGFLRLEAYAGGRGLGVIL